MKVVCYDLRTNKYITLGGVYDVIIDDIRDIYGSRYMIVNDIGGKCSYDRRCFKELSVIRNEKLKLIGIE